MVLEKAGKHHFIFYISIILILFLLEPFVKSIFQINLPILEFGFFLLVLIFLTDLFIFVVYGHSVMYFLGINHKTENPITPIDILLTSSAIITTFLLPDLSKLVNSLNTEFSFLLIILAVIVIYLIIYKINEKIFPFLFH